MPLLPNAGPPRPRTHEPIAPAEMMRLRGALQAALAGTPATVEAVAEVARQQDVPLSHAYAALATDPNLSIDVSQPVLVAICVGVCQEQGAIPNLERLLELRAERVAAGKPAFDVIPRTCLDMCAHAPVCLSRSPHGQAAHPRLTAAGVDELVAALCDE